MDENGLDPQWKLPPPRYDTVNSLEPSSRRESAAAVGNHFPMPSGARAISRVSESDHRDEDAPPSSVPVFTLDEQRNFNSIMGTFGNRRASSGSSFSSRAPSQIGSAGFSGEVRHGRRARGSSRTGEGGPGDPKRAAEVLEEQRRNLEERRSAGRGDFQTVFHQKDNQTMRLEAAKRQGDMRGEYRPPADHAFREEEKLGIKKCPQNAHLLAAVPQAQARNFAVFFHLPDNKSMRLAAAKEGADLRGPYAPPSDYEFRPEEPKGARGAGAGADRPPDFRLAFHRAPREAQMADGSRIKFLEAEPAPLAGGQAARLDGKLRALLGQEERPFRLAHRGLRSTDRENMGLQICKGPVLHVNDPAAV
eukprot:tig00000073_g1690.t1